MLGRFAEFFLFGLTPLVISGLLLPVAFAEGRRIFGEASYRERIALPPEAVLIVQLVRHRLADGSATVVAERRIEPAGQTPIRFDLTYDPAVIQPAATYALQAKITVAGIPWFASDRRDYDPAGRAPRKIALKLVSQAPSASG